MTAEAMESQIEAYEKGLEQLHAEVARLELIIKQKNRIITSLRRQAMILEETNRQLLRWRS